MIARPRARIFRYPPLTRLANRDARVPSIGNSSMTSATTAVAGVHKLGLSLAANQSLATQP